MTIECKSGNLLHEPVDALVNPVNCVGVMGGGLALQFKETFPDYFEAYRLACSRREIQLGQAYVHDQQPAHPRYLISFPTKNDWRKPSRLRDIETGLADLAAEVRKHGITSIAVPALGCGLGGLRWEDVRPCVLQALGDLEAKVVIFEPGVVPRR